MFVTGSEARSPVRSVLVPFVAMPGAPSRVRSLARLMKFLEESDGFPQAEQDEFVPKNVKGVSSLFVCFTRLPKANVYRCG